MSSRFLISLVLTLALILLMTACAGQEDPVETASSEEKTAPVVSDESTEQTEAASSEPLQETSDTDSGTETEDPSVQTEEPASESPHVHDWDQAETVSRSEPTCELDGSVTLRCSCGEERTDPLPATGHSYSVTGETSATCTSDGSRTYTCSRCGNSYEENLPALGHHYITTAKKDPTCEQAGWLEQTCDRCGESISEDRAPTGHSFTETSSEATCETAGVRTETCSVCGKTVTETIPALGHHFEVTETPATCDADGKKITRCTRCGKETVETTPALGHRYFKDVVSSLPGKTVEVCDRCGDRLETLIVTPILKAGYSPNWNASWNRQYVKLENVKEGLHYDDVYVGKTGLGSVWLFHEGTRADTLGTNLYTEAQLKLLATVMQQRSDWCASSGKTFYFLITPNKDSVYPEYLPSGTALAGNRRIDQVVNYLRSNTTVKVIDVRDALASAKAARPNESLYYPLDSHWNDNGGYAAYEAVLNVIRKDYPNAVLHARNEYQIEMYDSYFKDNAYYMGLYDRMSTQGPVYTLKSGMIGKCINAEGLLGGQFDNAYRDGLFSDGTLEARFECRYVNTPSVYVINDSFFIAMTRFFRDSFSKCSRHWTNEFSVRSIQKENPDIVIYQCVEGSLNSAFSTGALN